jgi:hypothetical protein
MNVLRHEGDLDFRYYVVLNECPLTLDIFQYANLFFCLKLNLTWFTMGEVSFIGQSPALNTDLRLELAKFDCWWIAYNNWWDELLLGEFIYHHGLRS